MRMLVKFSRDLLLGAAHTCSVGTATLGHKAVNHAVKCQSVIKAVFCKCCNLLDMFWRKVWAKQDNNIACFAVISIQRECEFFRHGFLSNLNALEREYRRYPDMFHPLSFVFSDNF